ncbi:MAG: hypothetical protein QXG86_03900, partial [Candidatus Woesearchaeota archaeon]
MKKGALWISAVLYILITALIMVIVLEALTPVVENLKDKSTFIRMRDTFLGLNQYIKEVSIEGQGSQRVVPIEIQKGELSVKNNQIKWDMPTDASILEPRSSVELGNLIIVANGDVDAYEDNGTFVLTNTNTFFRFNKFGSPSNFSNFTSNRIINQTAYKKGTSLINISTDFDFYITEEDKNFFGYSILPKQGSGLGEAKVIVHVNSSAHEYDLVFILESNADYLIVELKP